MGSKGRILVIDDEADMGETVATALSAHGFEATSATSGEEALLLLGQGDYDALVTDLKMPGMSGAELCERVSQSYPGLPVVVVTAFGSLDTAITAMRAGAYDLLTKPFELQQLALVLERTVKHRRMQDELRRLRREVQLTRGFGGLVGESPPMKRLFDLIDRVSNSDSSVLVSGESGTGKELVARALHDRSRRRGGPFVAVNCAAVPETLLESELFGHVRGAFTDARADRKGLFREAEGGTLFLDEVGDMPASLQAKLLRALQERTVRPVGGEREFSFDSRVLAATNQDLETRVEQGMFREDLYFRLNVIHIPVPPLRSRGNDVISLAHHFLSQYAEQSEKAIERFSSRAAQKLLEYAWPGNVRELQNCVERAVALARFEQIVVEDLPEKVQNYQVTHVLPVTDDPADLVSLDEVERRYVRRVLEVVRGNKSQAAKILGLDRKTLYRRIEKFGLGEVAGD